jgi:hypothetical protein
VKKPNQRKYKKTNLPNPVRPDEWTYYLPLVGKTMFECGGKVNSNVPGHKGTFITYKSYFEAIGIKHVSVDFDPRWADHNRDLRKPLWEEFGQFDMVCDIGTAEHIDGQVGFWENVHNLTKVGGVYVGQHPEPSSDSWWWHGNHYPTEQFYESFAELNGWKIERMARDLPAPNKNLYVRMRRIEEKDFTMPDESLIYFNKMRGR